MRIAMTLETRTVHIDHFGNVITNLVLPEDADPGQTIQVKTGSSVFEGLNRTYGDVDEGKGLLLVGSHNFLEIAVRQGSAAQQFGLARGDQVTVQF